jgi:hypothetical protein
LVLAAPLARAQDWDWSVAPYLWAAGIDGNAGLGPLQTDIDVDFSDLVDVLAGAALIHVEAQRGDIGLFGDLVFLALESDADSGSSRGEVEFDTTIVELGYLRNLSDVGVEFGVRYWDFDLDIQPTNLAALERNQDWFDGFVGVRFDREINANWSWITRANLGAGGSDLSYGVDTTFGRKLGPGQFVFGLKLLDVDYERPSVRGIPFRMDTMFLGATIGYAFD